jgi:mRNA interferase MazF
MTSFERGQVVLLTFPLTGQSGIKRRPAVVLSSRLYNDTRRDYIVAPITSNVLSRQAVDTVLVNWSAAGLIKPSVVKGILGMVEQQLVSRQLGDLTLANLTAVTRTFALILDTNIALFEAGARADVHYGVRCNWRKSKRHQLL